MRGRFCASKEPGCGRSPYGVASGRARGLVGPQDRGVRIRALVPVDGTGIASAAYELRVCLHARQTLSGCPLVSLHPGASRCRSVVEFRCFSVLRSLDMSEGLDTLVMCSSTNTPNALHRQPGGIRAVMGVSWGKTAQFGLNSLRSNHGVRAPTAARLPDRKCRASGARTASRTAAGALGVLGRSGLTIGAFCPGGVQAGRSRTVSAGACWEVATRIPSPPRLGRCWAKPS